jgi:exopolysaccharide biosynthesis polyprenyl glycosylphosphotransferase
VRADVRGDARAAMNTPRLSGKTLVLLDVLCVVAAVSLSHLIRFSNLFIKLESIALWLLPVTVVFYVLELYERFAFRDAALRAIVGVGVSGMFVVGISYAFLQFFIGRGLFILQSLLIVLFTVLWRAAYGLFMRHIARAVDVVICGPREVADKVAEDLCQSESYAVRGSCLYDGADGGAHLDEISKKLQNPLIIFVDDPKMPQAVMRRLIRCRMGGIRVKEVVDFYEDEWSRIPAYHLSDRWFVFSRGFTAGHNVLYQRAKRVFDVALAAALGALLSPLMLILAALIRLTSPGPVFYRQERYGINESVFEVIKFRSMADDAEKNGAVWAQDNDPRVTAVGRVMRRFRMDELPQIINIVRGEMSFVGPRPERPVFVTRLRQEIDYYSYRHIIRPGLTGWAQVNYPYGANVQDAIRKLEYDLYYIKNSSFSLDMLIMLKTATVVLLRSWSR